MDYSILRREYMQAGLGRGDLDTDPFEQFNKWFQSAVDAKIDLPDAMCLATASQGAVPSARMVVLRGFSEKGFMFYTDYSSQKGQEIESNPLASLVFYWSPLDRQIRISGKVEKLDLKDSEAYFHSRPLSSQLAATASFQSSLVDIDDLEKRYAGLEEEYEGKVVPLPERWGGYRVVPQNFEFWQGRPNRLHDRWVYLKGEGKDWKIERIAP